MEARHFLDERRLSMLALVATLAMLILSLAQPDQQIEWLLNDNGIHINHLQIFYGLLLPALLMVFIFEPRIRNELRQSHALGLVVFASMAVCFLIIRLIKPDQAWRFFRSAGLLWGVIAHAVLLCILAVLLALTHATLPDSARTRRYALLVAVLGGSILVILHIVSVGHFMGLDLPDEVWLASLATNVAERGEFYSSYLAGAFGNPDPFLPRYYLLMGEWVRLSQSSSLFTLRAFSLLVGALGVGVTIVALCYRTQLTRFQQVMGVVFMLGFSPLVRTSHNLRMDVGLVLYGALLLLGLLNFLRDGRSRWIVLIGVALALGLEIVPPLTFVINFVLGCALIVLAFRGRAAWNQVVLYAGVCFGAGVIYFALHFLPDAAQNLQNYASYTAVYYQSLGRLALDFTIPLKYLLTSAFLSPVEVIAIGFIVWGAWRSDRTLLLIFGGATLVGLAGGSGSYGYMAVLAPFLAYFAARALRSQAMVTIAAFLLIPGMLSAPIFDMTTAVELRTNQRMLSEIDLLSWRVPEGATVWADTVFWFTLHDKANFVGRPGPQDTAYVQGISVEQAVEQLGIDVIICNGGDQAMCTIGAALFGDPYEFNVTNGRYLMYSRLGTQ
jgi:hypothetical protein